MPMLPVCNSFTFGDIPDNQQPLQWVNSCCKGEPTQDDYYLVELFSGQTITASLSFIPNDADYDLAIYDKELKDYKAFSTNRGNNNELIVYTAQTDNARSSYYLRVILDKTLSKNNQYQLCVDVS
jgi:hypothetical protein